MRTTGTVLAWVVTRCVMVLLLLGTDAWVTGDVTYFADSLAQLPTLGLGQTLVEYPLPAVAVLAAPWLVVQRLGNADAYVQAVMVVALVTDAAFTVLLHRFAGPRRGWPLAVWILGLPLLGPTAYARFDLLPSCLVGAALLLLPSHPRVSAACASVATGVKLWPGLLLPGLVAGVRDRRRALSVIAGFGVALAGGSLLVAGWARLVSPLAFQADRGLQVESVVATPAMVAWWAMPDRWQVFFSVHHAYELSGPGVGLLTGVTTLLGVLLVLAMLVAWWQAFKAPAPLDIDTVVWLSLAATAAFMITGKVLSPQYLLWLLAAVAGGLGVVRHSRAALVRWALLLMVAALLTHLVFPTYYGDLVYRTPRTWLVLGALVLRNALLVVLLVLAVRRAVPGLRAGAQRGSALERQPPGPESRGERVLR